MSPILKHVLWVMVGMTIGPLTVVHWSVMKYVFLGAGVLSVILAGVIFWIVCEFARALNDDDELPADEQLDESLSNQPA